ncbi:hypothetical protein [Rubritalea tangerina]
MIASWTEFQLAIFCLKKASCFGGEWLCSGRAPDCLNEISAAEILSWIL